VNRVAIADRTDVLADLLTADLVLDDRERELGEDGQIDVALVSETNVKTP
jgi:hypothetical protein